MENEIYSDGLAKDPRTEEKKALDYQHSDLAGAVLVNWVEKPTTVWRNYFPREQDGSLSCVGQSCAKAFEILGSGAESAHPIYRNRANYPSGGMWLQDAGNICKNVGTTKETLDPSQKLGESQMNLPCDVVKTNKAHGYVFVNHKNIDSIAEAIELNKHCILIFHCNKKEWIDVPKYLGEEINFGHCVCAVDYFLYEGQKVLCIEDSTGHFNSFDKKGQRLIIEDFLKARCSGGMYLTPLPPIPIFVFTKTLKIGSIGNDVKMLQLKLNIGADGLFGKKTKAAVIKFQLSRNLVGDGIVGKLTTKALNKIIWTH